jgi:DNA-binding transcriptional MocR family regulator
MVRQYQIAGQSASAIAQSIERGIDSGALRADEPLPTIRTLASRLGVSPTTVNAAYTQLRTHGRIGGNRRGGSRIVPRAKFPTAAASAIRDDVRNLVIANPDAALLPQLRPFMERSFEEGHLYGSTLVHPKLFAAATKRFAADGIDAANVAVASGALDAIGAALSTNLVAGDIVALEDPTYAPYRELCALLGLRTIPVRVDAFGAVPGDVAKAVRTGAKALIVVPRAHNPTGAAFDAKRAGELTAILQDAHATLVIEDDYLGLLFSSRPSLLGGKVPRWLLIRSVGKSLGPDLRVAFTTADALTHARLEHRQRLSEGWVSWVLQGTVAAMLADPAVTRRLKSAGETYWSRRRDLVMHLRKHAIEVLDGPGFTVWIPVPDELSVVRSLDTAGWAVDGGTRYRFESAPGIRVVTTTMDGDEAQRFAATLAEILTSSNSGMP